MRTIRLFAVSTIRLGAGLGSSCRPHDPSECRPGGSGHSSKMNGSGIWEDAIREESPTGGRKLKQADKYVRNQELGTGNVGRTCEGGRKLAPLKHTWRHDVWAPWGMKNGQWRKMRRTGQKKSLRGERKGMLEGERMKVAHCDRRKDFWGGTLAENGEEGCGDTT